MQIVYSDDELRYYMRNAVAASPERPVLVDRFLDDATEVDVDCIADGDIAVIGAIMEHIEQAGVHSGDSACVIPAPTLSDKVKGEIRDATIKMAKALDVRGLMNVQFAVKDETVYVLEVNPRASRTVPFVSKAIGVPLAKLAAKIMTGKKLKDLKFTEEIIPTHYSLKEAVFPFAKFRGTDILLGPEMKSTGEVMGIDDDFGLAYAKSQMAAMPPLPLFRQRFHQRARRRQAGDPAPRARADPTGLCRLQHIGYGSGAGGRGRPGATALQADRGSAQCARDMLKERRHRAHHQHAGGTGRAAG